MQSQLADMRVDYRRDELDVGDLAATWHEQLVRWLSDATAAGVVEPNAMVLATTDDDGTPSSRTVLCKGIDERGVVLYTNYTSAKSHDLRATGRAAATFPWYALQRQVSLRGVVERVTPEETRAYWVTRPRGSQLGAWASAQSAPVADRRALDAALAATEQRFADVAEVPVPPHWGGWRIVPERVEFWQGRANRMHDRLRFELAFDGSWGVRRLAP
jgi:pyridoxamine 5'-phosphate oxidase